MNIILIAVLVLGTVTLWGASLFWLSRKLPKQEDETARNQFLILQQQMQSQMQLQIQQLKEEVSKNLLDTSKQNTDHLAAFSQQLNERMKETSQTLQNTQSTVGERLDNAARVVGQLQNKLGGLEESSKRILELGQGLNDLRDILKNPKLRGNMGEFFLEDLLRQILPPEHYKIQYAFRSGEVVDAIVNLGDAMVCIDSKFPLETFVRLIQIPEDEQDRKKKEKKAFVAAIKKHAESIAKKYILPDERTFDFAFMYIPAENIYYETIIRDDLMDDDGSLYAYLLQKRVIPVSPNSLYAYLQVIVLGLKGLKIQESAEQIMQDLTRLEGDLGKFRDDYAVLGKHLKNASGSYEEGNKRIDKFQQRYSMLTENNKTLKIADESVIPGANI